MLKKSAFAMLIFIYSSLALSELLDQCSGLRQEAVQSIEELENYANLSGEFESAYKNSSGQEKKRLSSFYAAKIFKKESINQNVLQYDFPKEVTHYISECPQTSGPKRGKHKVNLSEKMLRFAVAAEKRRLNSAGSKRKHPQSLASTEHLIETPRADNPKQEVHISEPRPTDNTEVATTSLDDLWLSPAPLGEPADLSLDLFEEIRTGKKPRYRDDFFELAEEISAIKEVPEVEPIKNIEATTTSFYDLDTISSDPFEYHNFFPDPLEEPQNS